jgi:cytochrome c biogenesis protein
MKIIIEDAIGSSGLELKVWTQKSRYSMNFFQLRDSYMELNLFFVQTDPGVPVVYAGFGALMLTTCLSYLSHSQVRIMFTC